MPERVWTNQYYNDPKEDSMTDTKETTSIEKILEDLGNDSYMTEAGFIVGKTYSGTIAVAKNPITADSDDPTMYFTLDSLKELIELARLVEAAKAKQSAQYKIDYAERQLKLGTGEITNGF